MDQEGNLYLLQSDKHRIYKRFKMTDFDSVQVIGGKGVGDEGFNFPSKLVVPNRQSVFVLDQMNRRLVQMNTNLRVVADVNFLTLEADLLSADVEAFWPISFAIGPSGESYFLNQDDLKIYKFTTAGKLERAFGGLDYGAGSLQEPYDLTLSPDNLVYAIDSSHQRVTVFDLFGTFQYNLSFPLDFRWKRVSAFDQNLIFLGDRALFLYDTFSKQGQVVAPKGEGRLVDVEGSRDYIYLLWENHVDLYPLERQ